MVASDRLLLDTVFAVALLNARDSLHARAKDLLPRFMNAVEVWVTEAVLIEIANSLSKLNRGAACSFIDQCYRAPNIHVVPLDARIFRAGLELYRNHDDKEWGLTDCISFEVMRQNSLKEALTGDHHFVQAGFRTLLGHS